jgi:site-specific DNA recombinase
MERLDSVVAEHIEHRLLQPKRLEQILSRVLDRREERTKNRATHIAELRKRASEAEAKLKRLYEPSKTESLTCPIRCSRSV